MRFPSPSGTIVSAVAIALFLNSCAKKEPQKQPVSTDTTSSAPEIVAKQPPLPQSDRYYVCEASSHQIFEINLKTNSISQHFKVADNLVDIDYDAANDIVFEAFGSPRPTLKVFDPIKNTELQSFDFPEPPSDILFHPVSRRLYIISEDSSYFRDFSPDSMKFVQNFPMSVQEGVAIGPQRLELGPSGKLIMANGPRKSFTQILAAGNYGYQTIIIHEAKSIDYAMFALDGKAAYCCDTKEGKIFKVKFGTGEILSKSEGFVDPRFIQIDIPSNTVILAVGKTEILRLHPDTFRELGRIDLSKYGDVILSLKIPPKANYAELLMDHKGVTRWIRFDVTNWEVLRLVELI